MSNALLKKTAPNIVGVQWLRGFSAVMVVLFHTTQQLNMQGLMKNENYIFHLGTRGVDLFFVISGFIITYVHHADLNRPHFLPIYGLKRLGRIFPLYWTILFPLLALTFMLPHSFPADDRVLSRVMGSIFLFPQSKVPILGVAWTLSFELFFYSIFAVAILHKRAGAVLGSIVVLGCLLFPLHASTEDWSYLVNFFFNPFNLEFVFGILVAGVYLRWKHEFSSKAIAIIVAAAILLLLLSQVPIFSSLERSAIWGGIGAMATYLLCVFGGKIDDRKYFWTKPAEILGLATYSLYLVHYPILVIWCRLFKRFAPSQIIVCGVLGVLVSLLLGLVVHYWVEAPQQQFISKLVKKLAAKRG